MNPATKWKIKSACLRAARTFLQSFVAVLIASGADYVDVSTLKAAGVAGGAAVLALVQRWLDDVGVSPIPPG